MLRLAEKSKAAIDPLATFLFPSTIVLIVVQQWPNMPTYLAEIGAPVNLMMLLVMMTGCTLAKLGKLTVARQKTISIEIGMQYGGVALLVTDGVLHDPAMSVAPVIYGLHMLAPVLLLVWVGHREITGPL